MLGKGFFLGGGGGAEEERNKAQEGDYGYLISLHT